MSNPVVVYKHRTNTLQVNLGTDVSDDIFTSQIRSDIGVNSPLICSWQVSFLTDGTDGMLVLRLDNTVTSDITATGGFMDIKRVTGGEPVPVGDRALEVVFRGSVTA